MREKIIVSRDEIMDSDPANGIVRLTDKSEIPIGRIVIADQVSTESSADGLDEPEQII